MKSVAPDHIHYTVYQPEGTAVKAAILLLHGMQEHSGRYERFANYLKKQGYAMLTYDHIGHGRTAKTKEQLGFFRRNQPDKLLVDDAVRMADFMSQRFPGVQLFLMGHSMGSFMARVLLQRSAHRFDGAILMGTGGPNPLAALFRPVLYMANLIAPTKRSKRLNGLFGAINNHKFRHEKPNDGTNWLSAGLTNRKTFLDDDLCGVAFSNNAFFGLISLNIEATRSSWAKRIPKKMPLLFVSGADDPIGEFGKGVEKTAVDLRHRGFEHVVWKLYSGMRHEILNEDDCLLVFDDITQWLEQTVSHNVSSRDAT
ncbi:Lysophospholipase, alpha-beta hydrolase superfamily [Parapedobacter luteus]|uniref:Lysophospholipase, alpha-beta hydrolase superfamily n=1 Tax=Parapedobacter luteus TaxID=623280 RepID=A0A1T5BWD8_9SPHI|nr:alpha/beta fold hydrolase [Parapedobacter luteus]SKB51652.1 Lysophospholipase, alpha-beta hydrolase superfamily [Parapedobacter luteus]